MTSIANQNNISYKFVNQSLILQIRTRICETSEELVHSDLFKTVVQKSIQELIRRESILLRMFGNTPISKDSSLTLLHTLQYLIKLNLDEISKILPAAQRFLGQEKALFTYIEYLYNYWRNFDRIIICDSAGDRLDKRPYRTFNHRLEALGDLIRKVYRDIQENLMKHPNIYRQLHAGANMGVIALPGLSNLPPFYQEKLQSIGMIRQILLNPPLVLETPMNKRTGHFRRVNTNPFSKLHINPNEWLGYPVKVGSLVILTFIHENFYSLGISMANLFQIATDTELQTQPAALFFYGVRDSIYSISHGQTCFYDDQENHLLIGTVPRSPAFGYFGYLKKMILTLHNIKKMQERALPFHGSFTQLHLKGGKSVSILLIGDSGAGKSETLEAFQTQGSNLITDITVIADDMGSLSYDEQGKIRGYGTEVGAFLRLDDLSPASTFGTIDRAIFMNATQTNSRVIIPISELHEILKGCQVDILLYANNYEVVNDTHPIISKFSSVDRALKVFGEGKAMAKGTTTAQGLQTTYFVNIFGPPEYHNLHDELATQYFTDLYQMGTFVGEIRTQLGIKGMEQEGPKMASQALLKLIIKLKNIETNHQK